jgi:hypothetical protein
MYARNLSIHLKPFCLRAFNDKIEKEILPLLRKQDGFRSELTFSDASGTKVTSISAWDTEAHANRYNASIYAKVLDILEPVLYRRPTMIAGVSNAYGPAV